ncbi:MAG TPA: hypothetical protein VM536_04745, partial [Chloroflexia bacterium]|nr:hypothetical protein [Chloroflexia bacterium]
VLHSADYHTAQPFAGQDVLVVGVGNSGSEIALDLARTARSVTLAVRSPMTVVPRRMFGVPTSELAIPLSYLPRPVVRRVRAVLGSPTTRRLRALGLPVGPPDQFPVIGVEVLDALKAGRISAAGGVTGFMPGGVRFADGSERAFDAVVLATGFRPALEYLADYVSVPDEKQAHFPTLVPGQPNLYLVGLYYDGLRGTLFNIGRQAREVAHRVHQSGAARVPDSWVIAAQRD